MKRNATAVTTAALLIGSALSGVALAEEPAKSAAPTIADVLDASGIVITGYVDTAYEHLSGLGLFSSGTADRVFDARENSFTVHQAAITAAKQSKEGFGAVLNLTVGQDAELIKSYPNTGGSNFDVTQAFVQYATGPLTVIAGKYVTLAGAEVINPTADVNFSRSILFGYAIPFAHTGLRAAYAVSDQLTLVLGVNNGWDQVTDANKQKTVELGLTYMPIKTFTFIVDAYVGKEPLGIVSNVPTAAQGQRYLVDVVATWNATDKLTVVANYDHGQQKDDTFGATIDKYKWDGAALYLNYQFTDQWSGSLRGEYLNDKNGYRTGVVDPVSGDGQKWKEVTLTFAYAPTKNFVMRIEGRFDKSNIDGAFVKSIDSATGNVNFDNKQNSVALEAIYKF